MAVLLPVSVFFAGCEKKEQINSLEVNPSSTIQFKASDNESVSLTVTTDAASWDYSAPDWVTAEKNGDILTVNVKNNTSSSSRTDRIEFTAGNAPAVTVSVYQEEVAQGDLYLNVSPSSVLSFKASGNEPVVLTVDTNSSSWEYDAPEWVSVEKSETSLTLNIQDNPGTSQRVGRLTVSAEGVEPVRINMIQEAAELDENAAEGTIRDESGNTDVRVEIATLSKIEKTIRFSLSEVLKGKADVEVAFDADYLSEYNYVNKTDYLLYPEELVSLASDGLVSVAAGQSGADVSLSIDPDSYALRNNADYLLPLVVRSKSTNVAIPEAGSRINYILSRKCKKEVKNVLYFEVNDVNPLNALEYRLEDGSMFFDAVILFAANINYDGMADVVYLHNNKNVQALLDETDVYIQPLREAGIKVYLGILGNHDAAGICQLSNWGAEQYAQELADAVKEYRLDGVNFDDEYSSSPILGNRWFTSPSSSAGAKLLYETKKAMSEKVSWDTEVSVFQFGDLVNIPAVEGHQPGEFVDFWVANYGFPTSPLPGMTKKNCSAMSVELSRDMGDVSAAYGAKDAGYGWFMWFSFDPVKKLEGGVSAFREASDGLYGMRLIEPTGIYHKLGEGSFDPKRYDL